MGNDKKPWEAEREVDSELARRLVAAVAPELAHASVEHFSQGWDNTAYLVDGRFVFRFPRRELAVPHLECEVMALPTLCKRLPLPIPEPVHASGGGSEFPWPYASYEILPGEVAAERDFDAQMLAMNAEVLASFLSALHAEPAGEWRQLGLGGDRLRRLDPAHRIPLAIGMLEKLASQGALEGCERLADIIEHSLRGERRSDVLVHSDFDSRHLLCDAQGRITGVIDWGDLHLGDPAVDLAVTWTFLPSSDRPAFFGVYGPVDDATLHAARFRAVHNSLHVLDWAIDIRASALEASARQWLGHIAED